MRKLERECELEMPRVEIRKRHLKFLEQIIRKEGLEKFNTQCILEKGESEGNFQVNVL